MNWIVQAPLLLLAAAMIGACRREPSPIVLHSAAEYPPDVIVLTTDSSRGFAEKALVGWYARAYVVDSSLLHAIRDSLVWAAINEPAVASAFSAGSPLKQVIGKTLVHSTKTTAVFAVEKAYPAEYVYSNSIATARFAWPDMAATLAQAWDGFPWPPPIPTATAKLPDGVCAASRTDTLGAVGSRIDHMLRGSVIPAWTYYRIAENGFAVVTAEMSLGDSISPARSQRDRRFVDPRSFLSRDGLRRLFVASPGRFLVLVIAVTPLPFETSALTMERSAAQTIAREGAPLLESGLSHRIVRNANCVVLAYVYEAKNDIDGAEFVSGNETRVDALLRTLRIGTERK